VYVAQLPPNGSASDPLAFTNVSSVGTRHVLLALVSKASRPRTILQVEVGHEEVCMNVIRAPELGSVLSGAAGEMRSCLIQGKLRILWHKPQELKSVLIAHFAHPPLCALY
jgi:hypothetical protein